MAYVGKNAKTGRWLAQINRSGRRFSRSFDTQREAKAWAVQEEAKAKRHRYGENYTLGDALDKYVLEVSTKKDGQAWEQRKIRNFAGHPLLGREIPLASVGTPQLAAWRDARLKEVSGSTVARDFNLLRNIIRTARDEWHWLEPGHDPFRGLRIPTENPPREATWDWRRIRRVLQAPRAGKTAEMQRAFRIALRTGMRLGEVLAAPGGLIEGQKVVVLDDVPGARKTQKVYRIPVGRKAIPLLKQGAFTVNANEGSVLFSKLCREVMVEGVTFHDSRATALTWMARRMPIEMLAKVSRHRDLRMLMVYYRPKLTEIADRIG